MAVLLPVFSICLLLPALVEGQGWGARPQQVSRPGTCTYTFTIDAAQMQDSCRTAELERIVMSMQTEYGKVKDDNDQLRGELDALRADYEGMVGTVKKLEADTTSWREVIEWPSIEMPFEPANASLIIMKEPSFEDCWTAYQQGHKKQGIYSIKPRDALAPFLGYCDDKGWNVIQRRFDGKVEFYRTWDEFSKGFGRLSGEFWLGLENIHMLTLQKEYEFRVEFLGWNGKLYYQNYDDFFVAGEMDNYAIGIGNMTSGNYKDVMSELDGIGFTAANHDNDEWYTSNCADYYRGGFWLKNCGFDPHRQWCEGGGCMSWGDKILKKSVLKIRPMEAKFVAPSGGTSTPSRRKPKRTKSRAGKKSKKDDRKTFVEPTEPGHGYWG